MSPVSSSKLCAPAAARVQVPFTLSDTRTSPGALYWLNHPTSRSPWATGRLSVTVLDGIRGVENATPWMKVGVATAGRGSRAPRVAIRARPPEERAEGRCFSKLPVLGAHESLACPQCKGEVTLTPAADGLVCASCKLEYPIKDDIPIMLIDEARRLA